MVKQQIDVKILLGDIEMHLPSDKGKTSAKFQQEPFKVPDQPRLQFPLPERFVQGQEIKDIGVFQGILGELCIAVPAVACRNWSQLRPGVYGHRT
jgi:hypothetical protein